MPRHKRAVTVQQECGVWLSAKDPKTKVPVSSPLMRPASRSGQRHLMQMLSQPITINATHQSRISSYFTKPASHSGASRESEASDPVGNLPGTISPGSDDDDDDDLPHFFSVPSPNSIRRKEKDQHIISSPRKRSSCSGDNPGEKSLNSAEEGAENSDMWHSVDKCARVCSSPKDIVVGNPKRRHQQECNPPSPLTIQSSCSGSQESVAILPTPPQKPHSVYSISSQSTVGEEDTNDHSESIHPNSTSLKQTADVESESSGDNLLVASDDNTMLRRPFGEESTSSKCQASELSVISDWAESDLSYANQSNLSLSWPNNYAEHIPPMSRKRSLVGEDLDQFSMALKDMEYKLHKRRKVEEVESAPDTDTDTYYFTETLDTSIHGRLMSESCDTDDVDTLSQSSL